jgi:hypothetical protein
MKRFTRKSGEPRTRNEAERKLRAAMKRIADPGAKAALLASMTQAALALPSPCADEVEEEDESFE